MESANHRRANSEEQEVINTLKKNLSKFACIGVQSLVNDIFGNTIPPMADAPHRSHSQPDDGIRVSGVDPDIHASDNINESYLRAYMKSSGIMEFSTHAEDEKALDSETACVVCEDNKPIMLFMPCMHNICCKQCSDLLKECPTCRGAVDMRVRVFRN